MNKIQFLMKEFPMSKRQAECAILLSEGLSNEEICKKLSLSIGTVKFHVTRAIDRTYSRNRVIAAVKIAIFLDRRIR